MENDHDRDHWEGDDRRDNTHWHVGREIPIAVVMAILIQTAGSVWWASALSTKMDALQGQIQELKAERYTASDARRDLELSRVRSENNERRITVLEETSRRKP